MPVFRSVARVHDAETGGSAKDASMTSLTDISEANFTTER